MTKIPLIDNYADESKKIASDLKALAYLLGEREEEVYAAPARMTRKNRAAPGSTIRTPTTTEGSVRPA